MIVALRVAVFRRQPVALPFILQNRSESVVGPQRSVVEQRAGHVRWDPFSVIAHKSAYWVRQQFFNADTNYLTPSLIALIEVHSTICRTLNTWGLCTWPPPSLRGKRCAERSIAGVSLQPWPIRRGHWSRVLIDRYDVSLFQSTMTPT